MKNVRVVKIKTWDKMVEEFGISEGTINCLQGFTEEMEEAMPKNRIIVLNSKGVFNWSVGKRKHGINDDMIEEELNPDDYPQYFI
jgi:hypothetical protein